VSRRAWAWLGAAVVGVAALVYGAVDDDGPRSNADRAYGLAQSFGCPVCDGQSVAESDALVARNIRASIGRWVDEGRSDDYIRTELVAAFGEDVDYTPSAEGVTSLVWILPVVGGAGAAAGLTVVFLRWRREAELEATAEDEALVAEAREQRQP
jgi:cytochrome c-type biogenesis protein CcmH